MTPTTMTPTTITKKKRVRKPPRLRAVISIAGAAEPLIFDFHTRRRLTTERVRLAMEAFKNQLTAKGVLE
jgi:hypothetical protein